MSMEKHDDLVNRLTHRLRIDPELRMDVAHELRAHLEDSTAEFRRGGYSEKDAAENAVKALGDETELSMNLWLANKKRVRVRQVVKWAGRVTLIPASILLTAFIALNFFATIGNLNSFSDSKMVPAIYRGWQWKLTPEQQFIFQGDPEAKTDLEKQKSIADRWPDNPVYYANYAAYELVTEIELNQFLTIFDRGEKLEPQNAFYNFMKAAYLVKNAIRLEDNPDYSFRTTDRYGKTKVNKCVKTIILNRARFERGLAEFQKGLAKPYYTSHTVDMLKLRLNLLPPIESFGDFLHRTSLAISVLLPDLELLRELGKGVDGYALDLAGQGNKEETVKLLNGVAVLATKMNQNTATIIEILVAKTIRDIGLGHAICAYDKLGLPAEARQTRTQLDQENSFFREIYGQTGLVKLDKNIILHGGVLSSILSPAVPGYRPQLGPVRRVEYIFFNEAALMYLLGILIFCAILNGLISLILLILHPNQPDSPKLLFVGLKPLARILFLAVILPIGLYILYGLLPFGGREYGINLTMKRLILEYTLVGAAMLFLLFGLSYSAIRTRAREAGIPTPPSRPTSARLWFIVPGILVGLSAVIAIAGWEMDIWHRPIDNGAGGANYFLYLAGLVALVATAWGFWEDFRLYLLPKEFTLFKRTYTRSLVPIFTLAAILVGLVFGQGLIKCEGLVLRNAAIPVLNEVENSDFAKIKDRYIRQHQKLLTEYLRQEKK
jgi:hypothetical protein